MAKDLINEAFLSNLQNMYFVELSLLKTLSDLVKKSKSEEPKMLFEEHKKQTEEHVKRLEAIFDMQGKKPKKMKSPGLKGLEEERKAMLKQAPKELKDLVNIGAAIKVERYEISNYETLAMLASQMEKNEEEKLLTQSMNEEEETLEKLQQAAEAYDLPIFDPYS